MNNPEAAELRRDLAEELGWTALEPFTYWREDYEDTYEVESLRGNDPHGEPREVPDYAAEPGAALMLVYAQLKTRSHLSLILYHEDNEDYRGPAVTLEDDRFDAPSYYGRPPDIMCDRSDHDRLAYALADAVYNMLVSEREDEP